MDSNDIDKIKELFSKAAENYDPGDHEWVEILRATRDLVAIITAVVVVNSPESDAKKRWDEVLARILSLNTLKDIAFAAQKKPKLTADKKPSGEYDS